jgi:vacuolar-type H+-ATPase subunit I/STV1
MRNKKDMDVQSATPKVEEVKPEVTLEILDESKLSEAELDVLSELRSQVKEINQHLTSIQDKLRMYVSMVGNRYFKEGTCVFNNNGQLVGEPKDV